MKFLLRAGLLTLLSLLVLAACAPAATSPGAQSDASAVLEDVALVANTGKPQLLDSHADW